MRGDALPQQSMQQAGDTLWRDASSLACMEAYQVRHLKQVSKYTSISLTNLERLFRMVLGLKFPSILLAGLPAATCVPWSTALSAGNPGAERTELGWPLCGCS